MTSALADGAEPWTAEAARTALVAAGIDPPTLLRALENGVKPMKEQDLALRLSDLWKSCRLNNNLEAGPWLKQAGRILILIPGDILSAAIDTAVAASLLGFIPAPGEILAIAKPALEERKRMLDRARTVVHGALRRPRYRWEPEERELADEDCVSFAESETIVAKFNIGRTVKA